MCECVCACVYVYIWAFLTIRNLIPWLTSLESQERGVRAGTGPLVGAASPASFVTYYCPAEQADVADSLLSHKSEETSQPGMGLTACSADDTIRCSNTWQRKTNDLKMLKVGSDFLPQEPQPVSWTSSQAVTAAANFCCCRMSQLFNKYRAIHFIEPRIKRHISVRECHFSCQLLAMSSSSLWAVAYGEYDALNLLQYTSTGVKVSGQTLRLERKMFLDVLGRGRARAEGWAWQEERTAKLFL